MPRKPKTIPFKDELRSARARAGITQEATAALVDYSLSSIIKFEGGKRTPRQPIRNFILEKLAVAAALKGGKP